MIDPKIEPKIVKSRNMEVCVNIKQVLEQIKKAFPHETYYSLAKRACVHVQTIQRWAYLNRAEAIAVCRLMNSLKNEEDNESVLLKDATPEQLRKQCQIIGWDKILNIQHLFLIYL